MTKSFASFKEEFLRFTGEIVWSTVTTVWDQDLPPRLWRATAG